MVICRCLGVPDGCGGESSIVMFCVLLSQKESDFLKAPERRGKTCWYGWCQCRKVYGAILKIIYIDCSHVVCLGDPFLLA